MVKGRVSLASIRTLEEVRQSLFPLGRRFRRSILESFVEANGVRHGARVTECKAQIAQVMHSHAGDDDEDVLLAQTGDGLAETVVLIRVFGIEEGNLHDWDVQGV